MEEEGLRSALAAGGEGPLVGKELFSPESNPRQSVSLLHAPYVQEVRLDIVQGLAYSPDGQEMGRQDILPMLPRGRIWMVWLRIRIVSAAETALLRVIQWMSKSS